MPDDEPLDDLRAVAMTAGAAAARVVETVVRDAQNRAQQPAHQQQTWADAQRRQAAAHTALATGQTLTVTPHDSPHGWQHPHRPGPGDDMGEKRSAHITQGIRNRLGQLRHLRRATKR